MKIVSCSSERHWLQVCTLLAKIGFFRGFLAVQMFFGSLLIVFFVVFQIRLFENQKMTSKRNNFKTMKRLLKTINRQKTTKNTKFCQKKQNFS